MKQCQHVFKRYEKKYIIDDTTYHELMLLLNNRMERDDYGKHTICNIYFDTWDYSLIRASLEKPIYKEKLRLRSYGVPGQADTVFIEVKKKYKGVVYKRRVSVPFSEAESYLYGREPLQESCQTSKEIDWFLNYYEPEPKVYIAYDRLALFGKENPELRVTFDRDIRWRTDQLNLSSGDFGSRQMEHGIRLMEVKIPNAMPIWMAEIFNELRIFPTSYSKYGVCYQNYLSQELLKGGVDCA